MDADGGDLSACGQMPGKKNMASPTLLRMIVHSPPPAVTSPRLHLLHQNVVSRGLDIIGKIPKSVGGHEYLFVAIDKFIKWVDPHK